MSVWVTSLNSGSNGNCYYIGNEKEAVLIDAGLTCRETEKRMRQLDLDIKKVRAIFISHEHGDHIKGVEVISHKYKIPVYITPKTLSHSRLKKLNPILIAAFQKEEIVEVGNLRVTAFEKYHDAADAHSFVVTCNNITIGVFTDLGRVCDQLKHYYKQCHAAFLEANYDVEMLQNGRYPYHLKQRISNGWGHLSNHQAFELFDTCEAPHLSHLFLSHLSADNNHPDVALDTFRGKATNVNVTIAPRYAPMALQQIGHSFSSKDISFQPAGKMQQASLFEI
jgi:phosphoribosyl 1,2-cyclic phosphodiesterase